MLWARRYFLLILPGLTLTLLQGSAGWNVSQVQDQAMPELAKISMPVPNGRLEQLLIQEFDRQIVGTDPIKLYQLKFTISNASAKTVSVQGTSSTLRSTNTTLSYQLYDIASGDLLTEDVLSATATSGAVSGHYAQSQSSQFTSERLAQLLGARLAQQLSFYFSKPDGSPAQ